MRWVILIVVLLTSITGCALRRHPHEPPPCNWPEPIIFTARDDPYTICFQETDRWETGAVVHCFSIRELRHLTRSISTN